MPRRNQLVTLCFFVVCAGAAVLYLTRNGRIEGHSTYNIDQAEDNIPLEKLMKDSVQRLTQGTNLDNPSSRKVEADHQLISILQQRKARLKEQCALMRETHQIQDVALHPPEQLIVNEEHRIIYCNVPKVACTNWKTVFLELGGFAHLNTSGKYHLGPNAKGRLYLDYLHQYNISQRRFMLQNYTKFVFVRHPFTRILSAFRNKLAPNISFFFRHGDEKEQWVSKYGKQIIKSYRGNSEARRVSSNWKQEYDLTFSEFIRFLVDADTDSYNKHWSDIYSMCLPCDIDYDIIGKYETINEDADFVLRLANIDPDITFPKPNLSSMTNSSDPTLADKFYRDVPRSLVYKLAMLYAADFNLFGYHVDPYI
ncbi:carbohydrate sulfotransferase 11-like isoform X1 [Strongylocentrotus purpuratus]|uniref:Carbohydrate sulfotransferase n=2 Tax=Strongylocentrotus purpuratus TaxID=7668 RepID=A0A7M7PEA5_STRPU|nr:carbohydrate sulfotransferase 11-like isoform X1 [Strongylocentrotus purpuratus]